MRIRKYNQKGAPLHLIALCGPSNDFRHLSGLEWNAVQRMAETIGDPAVGAMLLSFRPEEQQATIPKFIQHEIDEEKNKLTLL